MSEVETPAVEIAKVRPFSRTLATLLLLTLALWGLSYVAGAGVVCVRSHDSGIQHIHNYYLLQASGGMLKFTEGLEQQNSRESAPREIIRPGRRTPAAAGSTPPTTAPAANAGGAVPLYPNEGVGPDGWSFYAGPASRFQATAPEELDTRSYYHLGNRWLPMGTDLAAPLWALPLIVGLLTAFSTINRIKARKAA